MGFACGEKNKNYYPDSSSDSGACCSSCQQGGSCCGDGNLYQMLMMHKDSFVKGLFIAGGTAILIPGLSSRDTMLIFALSAAVDIYCSDFSTAI